MLTFGLTESIMIMKLMEDVEVRKGFISALLNVKPEEITRTELLSTHLRKEHEEDKLGILDVRVFVCGQSGREEAVLGERSHKGESMHMDFCQADPTTL